MQINDRAGTAETILRAFQNVFDTGELGIDVSDIKVLTMWLGAKHLLREFLESVDEQAKAVENPAGCQAMSEATTGPLSTVGQDCGSGSSVERTILNWRPLEQTTVTTVVSSFVG